MPTNDERREVAKRLRELPNIPSELNKWKGRELFIEPSSYDEADYSQIHYVLLGCFPAELMHPCDYEELHARLADLIEPEPERTCHIVMVSPGEWECDACGGGINWNSYDEGDPPNCNYCPNCGARVEEGE